MSVCICCKTFGFKLIVGRVAELIENNAIVDEMPFSLIRLFSLEPYGLSTRNEWTIWTQI
jgi:hypothetical protein